jgi:hypothetical protein
MTAERRVRRGGRMAMHDLTQGPSPSSLDMPVPEADTEDEIFLAETESLKTLLAASGFREMLWRDRTAATIAFFETLPDPGPLSLAARLELARAVWSFCLSDLCQPGANASTGELIRCS